MFEKRDELLDAVEHACYQCIHMARPFRSRDSLMKRLGTPIKPFGPEPLSEAKSGHPAFGWTLSSEAKRDIQAIEHNRRMAPLRMGNIILD